MVKLNKNLAITAILTVCISLPTFAQMTKSEVEIFVKDHFPKDVEKFSIVNESSYGAENRDAFLERAGHEFDSRTTIMTAKDNYLHIKDGTSKEMYIPYSEIRALSFQPSSDKKYSRITIFM